MTITPCLKPEPVIKPRKPLQRSPLRRVSTARKRIVRTAMKAKHMYSKWRVQTNGYIRVNGHNGDGDYVCFCPLDAAHAVALKRVEGPGAWFDLRGRYRGILPAADSRMNPYRNSLCRALGLKEDAE